MTESPIVPKKTVTFFKSGGKFFCAGIGTFDTADLLAKACAEKHCPDSERYTISQGLYGSFNLNIF